MNLDYLKQLPWSHELRHDAESASTFVLSTALDNPGAYDASKLDPCILMYLNDVDIYTREGQRKYFLTDLIHRAGR